LDGSDDQIELRPKPGTPRDVTQNIRKLIKQFSEEYENLDLSIEGDEYPLGGHIHLGVGRRWYPPEELITLLDDFIGRPTIELSGEARCDYKELSNVRKQPHGFEYRTPPSAIFMNPAIANICMKLARNITKKYLNSESFEYDNRKLTESEYVTIGGLSKQQAKYFMKFCREYKPTRSVRASWKVKKINTSKINIVFRDSWNITIKETLSEFITKELKGIVKLPITIKLYGLGEKRGTNLCTLKTLYTEIYNNVSLPTWVPETRTLNVGMSFDRRQNLSYVFLCDVTDEIKKIIKANGGQ